MANVFPQNAAWWVLLFPICISCQSASSVVEVDDEAYEMEEKLVKLKDTAMVYFSGFQPKNKKIWLQQRWETNEEEEWDVAFWPKNVVKDLSLFADGQFSANNRSNYSFGTWDYFEQQVESIVLNFTPSGRKEILPISTSTANRLIVNQEVDGEKRAINFSGNGIAHKKPANDPFHPKNQTWRIPPSRAETPKQIYTRALNCLRFYALYFRDNIKQQQRTISFEGLPGCFKWYSGGIGLVDKDMQSTEWKACFYNEEAASMAYDCYNSLLLNYQYIWPAKTPNWVYQSHNVLEQMVLKMEKSSVTMLLRP